MPKKYQAAFFDMGETLYTYDGIPLSWKDQYEAAWKNAFAQHDYSPTDEQLKDLGSYMNRFDTRVFPREVEYDSTHIISGALESIEYDSSHVDDIIAGFFNYYRQNLIPYHETVTALNQLRAHNVFIGALTDVAYGMPRAIVADDLQQVGVLGLIDSGKLPWMSGSGNRMQKGSKHSAPRQVADRKQPYTWAMNPRMCLEPMKQVSHLF